MGRACPYLLSVHFEADNLKEVELTLFFLNPRFVISKESFVPADVDANRRFRKLLNGTAPCGLVVVSDPDEPDPS
jgi:hypothetical protein